jgi:hypothetical protein
VFFLLTDRPSVSIRSLAVEKLSAHAEAGNAEKDGNAHHWLVGFSSPEGSLRKTEMEAGVRVKWCDHPSGDSRARERATTGEGFITLCILVRGCIRYYLKEPDGEVIERVLQAPGDYIVYDEVPLHWWETPEETLEVTIRWPADALVSPTR